MRVASWNVQFPGEDRARRQGRLLRELGADLILLQEVNPRRTETPRRACGADWLVRAVDLVVSKPPNRPVKNPRGVAIVGCGQPPERCWVPADVHVPERILLAETAIEGRKLTVVSYHAPDGETWGIEKPRQAVTFARWLSSRSAPVIMGADANTPRVDPPDFTAVRTHWHTGDRHLKGEPGDDLLFGPAKIHALDDALRCWLRDHPPDVSPRAEYAPSGPLAITHHTGKRKTKPGTGRRYDALWITQHWTVQRIGHLYDEAVTATSDHAVVIVDLSRV